MMRTFHGQRVTVMGLGNFGGGLGAARWLASQGARLVVTDVQGPEKLQSSLLELQGWMREHGVAEDAITLRLGGHEERDFAECDLVVANPAVPRPWDNPFLQAARRAGVPVTTEISLLVQRLPARERVIGITGSVGKSTTTAMIAHALRGLGEDVLVGGNLGGSLLMQLGLITARTWVVLELSSAQLHWLHETLTGRDAWSPGTAVVTGFAANHLDWHGELPHYRASKEHLLRHQRAGDTAILGPHLDEWAFVVAPGVECVRTGPEDFSWPLLVPGDHNRANAAAALGAVRAVRREVPVDRIAETLRDFAGLSHRLEFVGEIRGVRYFNDSKSTTPEALMTALEAICSMPGVLPAKVHLIAGGYDKKTDLSVVGKHGRSLGGLYTIGATGDAIAACAGSGVVRCGTLSTAMVEIKSRVREGDVVLLSPACASWDQFDNFEQRGELFRVLALGESQIQGQKGQVS
jgi:UDP-N-acetylmuramoylalanine--D-glutamate ligase